MIRSFKLATYLISAMLTAAIAGCERQTAAPAAPQPNVPSIASTHQAQTADDAVPTRQSDASPSEAHPAKDTMQISSSPSGAGTAEGVKPAGKSDAASAPKVDAKDAYKEESPTLLGLTLKSSSDDVLAKLGKAKTTFTMEDDADPITVYDFAGFSVGFNKNNALEFVDVHSADVDPGLHGLRIGQKSADAISALGKPDTNSTYVLTYRSKGTILKLDLDPKTDTIRSIKLFAFK